MLDSERTFKIKVRLCWTVFEILLTSAIICVFFCAFLCLFNESNIWAKVYLFEKLRYKGQLLLKLQAVEVATSFIEYRLDQLNSKHKNSSKLDNTIF